MPARWSADSVLALAPDDSSRRAAVPLARPVPWDGAGAGGDLVWGLCAGSGKNPYQVIVDLAGPAFKCSCPSRKFPCKHALALLLLWSAGTVPDQSEPADYARTWQEARQAKANGSKPSVRTGAADSPAATGATAPADEAAGSGSASRGDSAGQKDEAAARRAAERAGRVTDGLADLREWLRDQVRAGLAGSGRAGTGQGGADQMAARMVDAQTPGVAAALRGLAGAAADGPGRLLAEYALLHLLIRAHERLAELPDGLAAVVRSRVGYPVRAADALAGPVVTDQWLVLAVREITDATVPGRRIWLRGRQSKRWAMLLTFAAPNGAWQDPGTARLRPGIEVHASLHYYPGQPPLRALIGTRHADPVPGAPPGPGDDVDALLAHWSAALEEDPWLTTWPALLTGTPVPSGSARLDGAPNAESPGKGWYFVDGTGAALPLADRRSLWTLLAVSGGQPVTVAGEWHPDGLVALTTWHGDQAVAL
jgi:SWIM zinc finger